MQGDTRAFPHLGIPTRLHGKAKLSGRVKPGEQTAKNKADRIGHSGELRVDHYKLDMVLVLRFRVRSPRSGPARPRAPSASTSSTFSRMASWGRVQLFGNSEQLPRRANWHCQVD